MSYNFTLHKKWFHYVLNLYFDMLLDDDGDRQSKHVAGNIICSDALYVQVIGFCSKTDKTFLCCTLLLC
jgi:hypothetical protein